MIKIEDLKIGDTIHILKDVKIGKVLVLDGEYQLLQSVEYEEHTYNEIEVWWWLRCKDANRPHWLGSHHFKVNAKQLVDVLNSQGELSIGDKVILDCPQIRGIYYIHTIDKDFYYLLPLSATLHVNLPSVIAAKEWVKKHKR